MNEFNLKTLLENEQKINQTDQDKEIIIEHKRINASFKFLVPRVVELYFLQDIEKSGFNIEQIYKILSLNLVTKIDNEMLKALKVHTQIKALKKLFTEDEIVTVLGVLMNNIADNKDMIKKQ